MVDSNIGNFLSQKQSGKTDMMNSISGEDGTMSRK